MLSFEFEECVVGRSSSSRCGSPSACSSLRSADEAEPPVLLSNFLARSSLDTSRPTRQQRSYASPPPPSPFKPPRWGQPTPLTHSHLLKKGEVVPGIGADEFEQRRRDLMDKIAPGGVVVLMGAKIQYSSQSASLSPVQLCRPPLRCYLLTPVPLVPQTSCQFSSQSSSPLCLLMLTLLPISATSSDSRPTSCTSRDSTSPTPPLSCVSLSALSLLAAMLDSDTYSVPLVEKDDTAPRGHKMILFVPLRTAQSDLWDGGRSGLTGAVELFNADEVRSLKRSRRMKYGRQLTVLRHRPTLSRACPTSSTPSFLKRPRSTSTCRPRNPSDPSSPPSSRTARNPIRTRHSASFRRANFGRWRDWCTSSEARRVLQRWHS